MSCGEKSVGSLDQLRKAVPSKPDNELVTVRVSRHRQLVPLTLTGKEIGIDGKFVRP